MSKELMSNTMLGIILQSDMMTKFVLGTLLILSIICWTIALYKIMLCRARLQEIKQVQNLLKEAKTISGIKVLVQTYGTTLPGIIMQQWLTSVHGVEKLYQKKSVNLSEAVSCVSDEVASTTDEVIAAQKMYMPVISATVAASPLLGLLGTVWGLVDAFLRMSEKQSADIVTVAPGIAEALITTVAGLLVAIPALFIFYVINYYISTIEDELMSLETHLATIARTHFVEHHKQHDSHGSL